MRHQASDCYFGLIFMLATGSGVLSRFVSVALAVSAFNLTSHLVKSTFATNNRS